MSVRRQYRPIVHTKTGIWCACDPIWLTECWLCTGSGEYMHRQCRLCYGEGLQFACNPDLVDVVRHRDVTEEVY